MAQPGSAPALGAGGPRFESGRPDHFRPNGTKVRGSRPPGVGSLFRFEARESVSVDLHCLEGAEVKQGGKRLCELARDLIAVAQFDADEDRLVQQPPDVRRREFVGPLDVGHEQQGPFEVPRDLGELDVQPGCDGFGLLALAGDAGALFFEQLARDAVGVVSVEQLALLDFQFGQDAIAAAQLTFARGGHPGKLAADGLPDAALSLLAQDDFGVVALDQRLDVIGTLVALPASAELLLSADEVLVGAAIAGVGGERQPPSALAAVDGALEVMGALAVALAAPTVRLQDIPDPLERRTGNQGRMPAGIFLSPVRHRPGVVVVGQQPVDVVLLERAGGIAAVAAAAQPAGLQQDHQVAQRVAASRVGLERPSDQRRALRVERDGPHVASVDALDHVQVPQRCDIRRAAAFGLLRCALDDLVAEVAAVVLGEAGKHPVHQPPGRGLVNVLGRRDQPRAARLNVEQHVCVVAAVARETIDLPQHHVVHVLLLTDALQHADQLGPVVGLRRLRPLDVLADDLRAKLGGSLCALLALALDRQPVLAIVGQLSS